MHAALHDLSSRFSPSSELQNVTRSDKADPPYSHPDPSQPQPQQPAKSVTRAHATPKAHSTKTLHAHATPAASPLIPPNSQSPADTSSSAPAQNCQSQTASVEHPQADDPNPLSLTPLHLRAITLLLAGHTDCAVAKYLNLSRMTLYRWKNFHPTFQAEYNRLREETWLLSHQRLRAALFKATRILTQGLNSKKWDRRFRSAHALLSHAGPRQLAPPQSIIDADILLDQWVHHYRAADPNIPDPQSPIPQKERAFVPTLLSQTLQPEPAESPTINCGPSSQAL